MIAFGLNDRTHERAEHRAPPGTRARRRAAPTWLRTILGVPLEMKLLGANLIIMLAALAMLFGPVKFEPTRLVDGIIVVAALAGASLANIALVRLALRPIKSLTQVAWLVSQGLLGARVPASIMADRELTQLSRTVNQLLDDIVAQRDKIDSMSEMHVIR
jgi:methyl-accepting chemotaxis protein